MKFCLSSEPTIGLLILIILLYVLLKLNDIDVSTIYTPAGFKNIYENKPWIIFLAIAMITYAGYSMYLGMQMNKLNNYRAEPFDQPPIKDMSFIQFYEKFVLAPDTIPAPESEAQSLILPPNHYVIFRTTIKGIRYYLIMDSRQNNLPYRKDNAFQSVDNAPKAALCQDTNTPPNYIYPILLREDLLTSRYTTYIKHAVSTVQDAVDLYKAKALVKSQKTGAETLPESIAESKPESESANPQKTAAQTLLDVTIYPRFTHHMSVMRFSYSDIPNNKFCYKITGVTNDIATDVMNSPIKSPYYLNVSNSFSESAKHLRADKPKSDLKFVCGMQPTGKSQDKNYNIYIRNKLLDPDNVVTSETLYTSRPINVIDDSILFTGIKNTNIQYLNLLVNLLTLCDIVGTDGVVHQNTECYYARLEGYTDTTITIPPNTAENNPYANAPTMYPVGIVPKKFVDEQACFTDPTTGKITCKTGKTYIDGVDYSDARIVDFEVACVELNPL